MKLPFASSPAQVRQTKEQFANPNTYLDYELGKAVQELPPLYTRLVGVALSLVVFGAIAWAGLSKVDEVAVAPGKLIPGEQDVQPVRSLSSGRIKYINETKIKEGHPVQKGDILVALDSELSQTDSIKNVCFQSILRRSQSTPHQSPSKNSSHTRKAAVNSTSTNSMLAVTIQMVRGGGVISGSVDYLSFLKNPTPPKLCLGSPPRSRGGDKGVGCSQRGNYN